MYLQETARQSLRGHIVRAPEEAVAQKDNKNTYSITRTLQPMVNTAPPQFHSMGKVVDEFSGFILEFDGCNSLNYVVKHTVHLASQWPSAQTL